MKTLEELPSKNSEHINDIFSTLDTKGIELELVGIDRGKNLKIILDRLNVLGELKLYPYQYEMINMVSEFNTENSLQELLELATNPKDYLPDIPSLKKEN